MAFGQQSGPPASHQQLKDLLELLQNEGYTDFRDARGPMGFTQRQAGGKFTRDEAQEWIDRLEAAEDERIAATAERPKVASKPEPTKRPLGAASDEDLVAELRHRGWMVSRR